MRWSDAPPQRVWTLEDVERQAARGGVNRQQAQQLVDEVRRLRDLLDRVRAAAADALEGHSPDDLVDALDAAYRYEQEITDG